MENQILTYSKIMFNPLEAKIDDITIKDIAHSLSLMTRANGHIKHFYSVGQHSLNCYREACSRGYSERVQLGCLLHDASESYISDLTRPVKLNFVKYYEVEEKLQNVIYERFGLDDLTEQEIKLIGKVDDAILFLELRELMDYEAEEIKASTAREHDLSLRDFAEVEQEFLDIFKGLYTKE